MVHGEAWTIKEFFVYPNEYIYWSIQIVMYPFLTGLVAGAFVLSSLYHVIGIKELKDAEAASLCQATSRTGSATEHLPFLARNSYRWFSALPFSFMVVWFLSGAHEGSWPTAGLA